MDYEQDDAELSALEYARMTGLSIAYDSVQPHIDIQTLLLDKAGNQEPWILLNTVTVNDIDKLTKERLAISKDAALLLRAMHELQLAPSISQEVRIRDMKQELPLLSTDEELDMLEFGHRVVPDFRNLMIPTEMINVDDDEGFEWPMKYHAYPSECDRQISAVKLAISRDGLLVLQEAVSDPYVPEDCTAIEVDDLKYQPNACRRSVTPPILPLSPPLTPYIPSSPANRLCLPSDSTGSVTAEAKALEHQIMAADSLTRKHSDSSDSMLLDFIDFDELPPVDTRSTILKRRASQFMVEGPLTPPILSDSPMKKLKTVSFTAELSIEIPPAKWVKKVGEEELTDYGSSHESEDLSMMETFHEQVTRMVENETLDAADTTGRVDVPELEFVYPVAPWDEYSRRTGSKRRSGGSEIEAQMQFIKRVKLDDLRSAAPWSGLSALERELRWNIFTSRITKITLDEKLHGETECEKMLGDAKLGQIATSSSQVWKREGLRLLDEDDEEDEELASADLEEQRDIESLIRKRKLELDEAMEEVQPKRTSSSLVQGRQGYTQIAELEVQSTNTKRSSQKNGYERKAYQANPASKPAMPIKSTGDDLMFGGFSATSALHKFMRTQGKAVQHINAASKDEYQTMTHPKNRNDTFTVRRKDPAPHILQAAASQSTTATPPSYTLPDLPNIPEHLLPAPFIISSAYLQRRSLIKQIERHYPSAELIYRDYTLSHSPSQEADMILSPSTGLIETTLQKIKQQPLPGQTDRSPDKLRMKQLHLRYERLVVLVSEGLIQEMEDHGTSRPTDSRDKEAIKMFRDLADSLEGEVLVEYVPGGEQALARTMVLQMAKYGLPRGSRDIGDVRLLDTETSWEVFLRRTGFNPYAAQVIVALLKRPFEMELPSNHDHEYSTQPTRVKVFGLTAFLLMNEEERINAFQALMGGSRILRRASKVLSQEWVSAAHGFRV